MSLWLQQSHWLPPELTMGSVDIISVFILSSPASVCVAASTFEAAEAWTQSRIISLQYQFRLTGLELSPPPGCPLAVHICLYMCYIFFKKVSKRGQNNIVKKLSPTPSTTRSLKVLLRCQEDTELGSNWIIDWVVKKSLATTFNSLEASYLWHHNER